MAVPRLTTYAPNRADQYFPRRGWRGRGILRGLVARVHDLSPDESKPRLRHPMWLLKVGPDPRRCDRAHRRPGRW